MFMKQTPQQIIYIFCNICTCILLLVDLKYVISRGYCAQYANMYAEVGREYGTKV